MTLRERPRSARSLLTVQDAVRAICVWRAALFERSEFQHAANGTLGKRSGAREPTRGQAADANLFRRTSQTAVGGQLPYEGEPLGAPAPDFQSLLRRPSKQVPTARP